MVGCVCMCVLLFGGLLYVHLENKELERQLDRIERNVVMMKRGILYKIPDDFLTEGRLT